MNQTDPKQQLKQIRTSQNKPKQCNTTQDKI